MEIVFLYDGTPFIVGENTNGKKVYPDQNYTDVEPPEGIYQPYHFDGERWIGSSEDEWRKQWSNSIEHSGNIGFESFDFNNLSDKELRSMFTLMQKQVIQANIAVSQIGKQNTEITKQLVEIKNKLSKDE